MNFKPAFYLLLIALAVSSCASYNGNLSSNAVLVNNKFRVIGTGIGISESKKVLGFGGLQSDALVYEAKNYLYSKIDLKSGQALTNITVDFKREFYFLFSKTTAIVTGEIVDFNPTDGHTPKNNYGLINRNGYSIGEHVYVKAESVYKRRKVVSLDINELQVEPSETSQNTKPLIVKYEDSFRLKGSFVYNEETYTIGDKITVDTKGELKPSAGPEETFEGIVIGISKKKALLQKGNGKLYKVISVENE